MTDDKEQGKTDWDRLKRMTNEEILEAALSDPDAQPLTDEQLAQMRRVPAFRALIGNPAPARSFKEFVEKINSLPPLSDEEMEEFISRIEGGKAETPEEERMRKAAEWYRKNKM